MTELELYQLDALGWIIRPDLIPLPLVKALRDQIKEGTVQPPGGAAEDLLEHIRDIPGGLFDDYVLDIAMMRTLPKGSPEGTTAGFHGGSGASGSPFWYSDTDFKHGRPSMGVLSVLVELDESPGTRIIPGSHRSRIPIPRSGNPIQEYQDLAQTYYARPGTVVAWNEHVAHWGPPGPDDNDRRTFVFKFTHPRMTLRGEPWDLSTVSKIRKRKNLRLLRDAYGRIPGRNQGTVIVKQ